MLIRTLCIAYLALSCACTLSMAFYAARVLRTAGTNAFLLFIVSIFMYTLGYAYELSCDSVETMYLALRIQYLGIPFISVFWFIFAIDYNGYKAPKRFVYPVLLVVPLVTSVLFHTNMEHHLHYTVLEVDRSGPFPVAHALKGVWYTIDFSYRAMLNFAGAALFGLRALRGAGFRKRQARLIFLGSLVPCLGNILGVAGVAPFGLDINAFLLSIVAPLIVYAITRLRLFDIVPIARDRVFKTIDTSVIVLDGRGKVVDFNDCAKQVFPCLDESAIGRPFEKVLPECGEIASPPSLLLERRREVEIAVNEGTRCFSVSATAVRSGGGASVGLIVSLHDITENKLLLRRMEHMATVDALTQVCCRRAFMELCLEEIGRCVRDRGVLSFLLIDIDYFKSVNDTFGHPAGDRVLQDTAAAFKRILRESDILGRYGGEEFAVVLPRTDSVGAAALAERLRAEVCASATSYEGRTIEITISVGIATASFAALPDPSDHELVREALLKTSDQALYQAKEQGRNRVCVVQLADG